MSITLMASHSRVSAGRPDNDLVDDRKPETQN